MCGGVAALMADGSERFEEQKTVSADLGKNLVQAIREQTTYPEQEAFHADMKERMIALVTANRDMWVHEYEYLKNRGWIE